MKTRLLAPALIACLFLIPLSCKKYIQDKQQDALIELVTNGTWRVTRYTDFQQTDLTARFGGYRFQFYENGTVYGIYNGSQIAGSWTADVNTKTIVSEFPRVDTPLVLLNYTWKITDSYPDSVAARTPVGGNYNVLNLHKN